MFETKEQRKKLNEMEVSNLFEKELKVMITQWELQQRNTKSKKVPNRSYNWTEKYTAGVQQQNIHSRMNKQAGRQNNETHQDRAAK